MITFGHPLIRFFWMLALTLCALIALLAGFALVRRALHSLGSGRGNTRRTLLAGIESILAGSVDYETGLHCLREYLEDARRLVIERLAADTRPERTAILNRLCSDLGLVSRWRSQLERPYTWTLSTLFRQGLQPVERIPGLRFVARAEAAENLGLVRDAASWRLLAAALDDPHLAVRSVAARALARIQEPAGFRALARKLQSVVLCDSRALSVRSLWMALASFPLAHAADLLGMLKHPHPRVRFLGADAIATMVKRAGSRTSPQVSIPESIAEIFLQRLVVDRSPDVRARAADVIGRVDDLWAAPALVLLLEDREWFVRLHATRALANHASGPIEALNRRLTDSNWRVREAAVQTLAGRGREGMRFLLAHFLKTQDRYSREQVAEQIERRGLIPSVLKAFGDPGATIETRFIKGVVRMGRTAALTAALQDGLAWKRTALLAELRRDADSNARSFMEAVLRMPPAGLMERLHGVPASGPDPEEWISA
jgi:HEAT repeat protein